MEAGLRGGVKGCSGLRVYGLGLKTLRALGIGGLPVGVYGLMASSLFPHQIRLRSRAWGFRVRGISPNFNLFTTMTGSMPSPSLFAAAAFHATRKLAEAPGIWHHEYQISGMPIFAEPQVPKAKEFVSVAARLARFHGPCAGSRSRSIASTVPLRARTKAQRAFRYYSKRTCGPLDCKPRSNGIRTSCLVGFFRGKHFEFRRPAISGRGLVGLWPNGRVLSTVLLLSGYSQHSSPLPLVAVVAVRIYVDNDLVAAERTILNPEP